MSDPELFGEAWNQNGLMAPRTRHEDRIMGDARETVVQRTQGMVQEVTEQARDRLQHVTSQVQEVVKEEVSQVRDVVNDEVGTSQDSEDVMPRSGGLPGRERKAS